jgi:hypothetical protein
MEYYKKWNRKNIYFRADAYIFINYDTVVKPGKAAEAYNNSFNNS